MYQSITKVQNSRIPISSLQINGRDDQSFSTDNVNSFPISQKNGQSADNASPLKSTFYDQKSVREGERTISEKDKEEENKSSIEPMDESAKKKLPLKIQNSNVRN